MAVHVGMCDFGVWWRDQSTSLIALYVNLNDVAQLVRIT